MCTCLSLPWTHFKSVWSNCYQTPREWVEIECRLYELKWDTLDSLRWYWGELLEGSHFDHNNHLLEKDGCFSGRLKLSHSHKIFFPLFNLMKSLVTNISAKELLWRSFHWTHFYIDRLTELELFFTAMGFRLWPTLVRPNLNFLV